MTNLERAAQCRRLACGVADDPIAEALFALAEEFEARAAEAGEIVRSNSKTTGQPGCK